MEPWLDLVVSVKRWSVNVTATCVSSAGRRSHVGPLHPGTLQSIVAVASSGFASRVTARPLCTLHPDVQSAPARVTFPFALPPTRVSTVTAGVKCATTLRGPVIVSTHRADSAGAQPSHRSKNDILRSAALSVTTAPCRYVGAHGPDPHVTSPSPAVETFNAYSLNVKVAVTDTSPRM